jgi:anti-anti-sigma regulatory factor
MEIRRGGARPVVTVSGELDLAGRELLEALLAHVRTTDPGPVALDLARVTFADTHGLSPALAPDVDLVAASPTVARVLRLLGFRAPRPTPMHGDTARPGRRRPHRSG